MTGLAGMFMRTIFATEGTPWLIEREHQVVARRQISVTLSGICTNNVPLDAVNAAR